MDNDAASDIGHVALDFDEGVLTGVPCRFNSLALRPTYRISLRLGNIEDLFRDNPDTEAGRMARLQVLGLFYFPLDHPRAATAFHGETVNLSNGSSVTLTGCWEWVKEKILKVSSDSEADEKIQTALQERVVGSYDAAWSKLGSITHGLPHAAAEEAEEVNFAKIRLPGGYSDMYGTLDPVTGQPDSYFGIDPLDPQRHAVLEDIFYRDNPVLGKIPIVAKVETKLAPDKDWIPLADATVCFQLVPPDALPGDTGAASPYQQYNRSVMLSFTRGLIETATAPSTDPSDPQGTNCPANRGGKRDQGVAGVLFKTDETEGFNTEHVNGRAPLEPHEYYPTAQDAAELGVPNAVQARTNAEGEAGAIFMPSRTAGDRYRIRAFVRIPSQSVTGEEATAVRVDTGTLVIWRNLRISRFLRKDVSTGVSSEVLNEAWNWIQPGTVGPDSSFELEYLARIGVAEQNPDSSYQFLGLPDLYFDDLALKFSPAFCELEVDDENATGPQPMDATEYAHAYQLALEDGKAGMAALGVSWDLDQLFHEAWLAQGFPNENSVAHLVMRMPNDFPLDSSNPPSQTTLDTMETLLRRFVLPGFFRALSHNGYLPGLTILQGAASTTWAIVDLPKHDSFTKQDGMACPYRGCFVLEGTATYSWRDFTTLAAHELGHCLQRKHASGYSPEFKRGPTDGVPEEHDTPGSTDPLCLMGYVAAPAEFCSKCLLALRGWKLA